MGLCTNLNLNVVQAEPALSLVQEQEDPQVQLDLTASLLDVPDADLMIRSSDLVNFRIHKSVLAMASPVFKDLLSLPQPSDSESVDGLSVVQLSEDAELLNSLVSLLYPVPPAIPTSYDKVLYLLAACQKYDMVLVQSSIRAEVSRGGFPEPSGAEVFHAYAIASSKRLIPEMQNAARRTLCHPMTFEVLGEGLRLFEGCALRDLASFRKRCRDNLIACLETFLDVHAEAPSNIWVSCPESIPDGSSWNLPHPEVLPGWLDQLFLWIIDDIKQEAFTQPLTIPSTIRGKYLSALQSHGDCNFCLRVHATRGSAYCAELEDKLAQVRDKVHPFIDFRLLTSWRFTFLRYAVIDSHSRLS
jgi:hypothetical protein